MSLDRLIFVQCDGCGRPCGTVEQMQETAKDARHLAKVHNWRTKPGPIKRGKPSLLDICPQCAPKWLP